MYDVRFIFFVVVTLAIRGSTETEDLKLDQVFRTPKDFSRVNFDHFEILERNNFDQSPSHPCSENEEESQIHHPKSVANAQVTLRFGGDDIKGRNRIEFPLPLSRKANDRYDVHENHPYDVHENHHQYRHLATNELRHPHTPYSSPILPPPVGQYPVPPYMSYAMPPNMYYPGYYYQSPLAPPQDYWGYYPNVPADERKVSYPENPFLGNAHTRNTGNIASANRPIILSTMDLSNDVIQENTANIKQVNLNQGPVVYPTAKKHNVQQSVESEHKQPINSTFLFVKYPFPVSAFPKDATRSEHKQEYGKTGPVVYPTNSNKAITNPTHKSSIDLKQIHTPTGHHHIHIGAIKKEDDLDLKSVHTDFPITKDHTTHIVHNKKENPLNIQSIHKNSLPVIHHINKDSHGEHHSYESHHNTGKSIKKEQPINLKEEVHHHYSVKEEEICNREEPVTDQFTAYSYVKPTEDSSYVLCIPNGKGDIKSELGIDIPGYDGPTCDGRMINTNTPFSIESIKKDSPLEIKSADSPLGEKDSPIHINSVCIDRPLDTAHIVKDAPLEIKSVKTDAPLNIGHVVKDTPMDVKLVNTDRPLNIAHVETDRPLNIAHVDKDLPVEIKAVKTDAPLNIVHVDKDLPIDIHSVHTDRPISISPIQKDLPIEIKSVKTDRPLIIAPVHKDSIMEVNSVNREEPLNIGRDLHLNIGSVDRETPMNILFTKNDSPLNIHSENQKSLGEKVEYCESIGKLDDNNKPVEEITDEFSYIKGESPIRIAESQIGKLDDRHETVVGVLPIEVDYIKAESPILEDIPKPVVEEIPIEVDCIKAEPSILEDNHKPAVEGIPVGVGYIKAESPLDDLGDKSRPVVGEIPIGISIKAESPIFEDRPKPVVEGIPTEMNYIKEESPLNILEDRPRPVLEEIPIGADYIKAESPLNNLGDRPRPVVEEIPIEIDYIKAESPLNDLGDKPIPVVEGIPIELDYVKAESPIFEDRPAPVFEEIPIGVDYIKAESSILEDRPNPVVEHIPIEVDYIKAESPLENLGDRPIPVVEEIPIEVDYIKAESPLDIIGDRPRSVVEEIPTGVDYIKAESPLDDLRERPRPVVEETPIEVDYIKAESPLENLGDRPIPVVEGIPIEIDHIRAESPLVILGDRPVVERIPVEVDYIKAESPLTDFGEGPRAVVGEIPIEVDYIKVESPLNDIGDGPGTVVKEIPVEVDYIKAESALSDIGERPRPVVEEIPTEVDYIKVESPLNNLGDTPRSVVEKIPIEVNYIKAESPLNDLGDKPKPVVEEILTDVDYIKAESPLNILGDKPVVEEIPIEINNIKAESPLNDLEDRPRPVVEEIPIEIDYIKAESPLNILGDRPVVEEIPIEVDYIKAESPLNILGDRPVVEGIPIEVDYIKAELPLEDRPRPIVEEIPTEVDYIKAESPLKILGDRPVVEEIPIEVDYIKAESPLNDLGDKSKPVVEEIPIEVDHIKAESPINIVEEAREIPVIVESITTVEEEGPLNIRPTNYISHEDQRHLMGKPLDNTVEYTMSEIKPEDGPIMEPTNREYDFQVVGEDCTCDIKKEDPLIIEPAKDKCDCSEHEVKQEEPIVIGHEDFRPIKAVEKDLSCPSESDFMDIDSYKPHRISKELTQWLNRSLVPYDCGRCGQKLLVSYPISSNPGIALLPSSLSEEFDVSYCDCPCCKLKGFCDCENCQCGRKSGIPYGKRFGEDIDALLKIAPSESDWAHGDALDVDTSPFSNEFAHMYKATSSLGFTQVGNQEPKVIYNGYTSLSGGRFFSDPFRNILFKEPTSVHAVSKVDSCKPVVEIDQYEQPEIYKVVPKYRIVPKKIRNLQIPSLSPTNNFWCHKSPHQFGDKMVYNREYLAGDRPVLVQRNA